MTYFVNFDSTFEFPVFELIYYLPNFSLNGESCENNRFLGNRTTQIDHKTIE